VWSAPQRFRAGVSQRRRPRIPAVSVTDGRKRCKRGNDVVTTVVECPECGRKNRIPADADGLPRCGNCHHGLPWLAEAGDDDFADVVEKCRLPVLVDLWALWCVPCRKVSPALEQVARDLAGRLKLVKVDVDRAPKVSERFTVRTVPTMMIFQNGEVTARRVGAASAPVLRQWAGKVVGGEA
jgi:thioredoxin 2